MKASSTADPTLPTRPKAWIKSITFSDDTVMHLSQHEVIVIVGPNNAGKSVSLREISGQLTNGGAPGLVIKKIERELIATDEGFAAWIKHLPHRDGGRLVILPYTSIRTELAISRWQGALAGQGLNELTGLVATHLTTEERLQAANDVESLNFSIESPNRPLQHLYDSDQLETKLSALIERAFRTSLVVNRGAGQRIVLHLGNRPVAPAGDRVAKTYRDAVNALPTVQSQGDGIRAYVGVLLQTIIIDHDIVLIDEPDAFLHPPQAATLGAQLAMQLPEPRQLIVATHSSDFLRGVMDVPKSRVRVVRIQRGVQGNHVRELSPDAVGQLWRDPLLRYSNVLDGLFCDGVIVCEADGDCRFYSAMMDATGDEAKPDLLLTYGGGKSRIPTIVNSLKALGVPVRAVLDFDVLRDTTEFRAIYEALGGSWNDVEKDHRIVQTAVQAKRPELSASNVKDRITKILEGVSGETLAPDVAGEIANAVKRASPWAEAKRVGKAFVPSADATQAYNRLVSQLRKAGLYLVEVGEVEQFCKSVSHHGPAWVIDVLDRDLRNDPELEEARKFAKELLSGW